MDKASAASLPKFSALCCIASKAAALSKKNKTLTAVAFMALCCAALQGAQCAAFKTATRKAGMQQTLAEQEQSALSGRGLSRPVAVGDPHFSPFAHKSDHTGPRLAIAPALGNAPAAFPISLFAKPKPFIVPSSDDRTQTPAKSLFEIRHEDAHAQDALRESFAFYPQILPATDAMLLSAIAKACSKSRSNSFGLCSWISDYRKEAFADARALLANAWRGPEAFKADAAAVHAERIASERTSKRASSLSVAGEEHATDPAIYLAAQLPPEKIARLKESGLNDLADQIAADATAFALARIMPHPEIGSPNSAIDAAAALGAAESAHGMAPGSRKADEILAMLRRLSGERPFPSADLAYAIGGEIFPAKLPLSSGFWRFDGFSGQNIYKGDGTFEFIPKIPRSGTPQEQASASAKAMAFSAALKQQTQLLEMLGLPKSQIGPGLADLQKSFEIQRGLALAASPGHLAMPKRNAKPLKARNRSGS